MKKSEVLFSADAFWSVNKYVAKKIGIIPALLYSELIWSKKRFKSDEFFITTKELEDTLGIGSDARRSATKVLVDLGLISVIKKGVPAKYYYVINEEKFDDLFCDLPSTSDAVTPSTGHSADGSTSDTEPPSTIIKKDIKKEIKKEIDNSDESLEPTNPKPENLKEDLKSFPTLRQDFQMMDRSKWFGDNLERIDIVNHAIGRFFRVELGKKEPEKDGYNIERFMKNMLDDVCPYEQIWEFLYKFRMNDFWGDKMTPTAKYIAKSWEQVDVQPLPDWKRYGYKSEFEYTVRDRQNQPSSYSTMQELKEHFIPKASKEETDKFLADLEGMKT